MSDKDLRELVTHYRRGLAKIIRTRHYRAGGLRAIALECLTHKPSSYGDSEMPPDDLVEYFRSEMMGRFSEKLSMEDISTFSFALAKMFADEKRGGS
jgi:hypothetical protein